ncbi:MAG: hypothetical protein IPN11_10555 [Opitutaceae bacterium]|nr:hypothetical protein [Opitutaceae bacterium]
MGQLTLEGTTLHGVTVAGGNPTYDGSVNGRIFTYSIGGGLTVPYAYPEVVWDGDHLYTPYGPGRGVVYFNGKFYGTIFSGGYDSYGTVFSVNANGTGYTTLHYFMNTDGSTPYAMLALSGDTLYGSTNYGGANNRGVIFSIKIDGTAFTVLHEFSDALGFGGEPGLLVVGNTLYGTTGYGGSYGFGTLYSLNTNGTNYTVRHSFNRFVDGSFPGRLIRDGNVIYGMTATGGTHDDGTIFSITLDSLNASFSSWAQTYFTNGELIDANVSGPNAVYGLDGLPNLVKYALGLDPTVDATTGQPEVSTTATEWVYTYTRPVDRTDIIYAVEVSTNLTSWGAPTTAAVLISTVGDVETWQAKHPLASATNAYFRLRVTQL